MYLSIEKEKYFELILDSVDTGVLVVDEERGLVLRCNQAAHKLLNREAITHFNQVSDALKKFSVRETHTILQQRRVRIIAFSDIGGELANQEIDSWVRLIRVLTHEIMNTRTHLAQRSPVAKDRRRTARGIGGDPPDQQRLDTLRGELPAVHSCAHTTAIALRREALPATHGLASQAASS